MVAETLVEKAERLSEMLFAKILEKGGDQALAEAASDKLYAEILRQGSSC